MITTEPRPLSDFYREDQRRIAAREFDFIVARHRMTCAARQFTAESERRFIKEIEL
jgi:hypothetical protein